MSTIASRQKYRFIWLRHGDKLYDNSEGPLGQPQHDPPLVDFESRFIQQRGRELTDNWGLPVACLTSPYLRTRLTAEHLTSVLHRNTPEMIVDPKISEYLGFQGEKLSNPKDYSHLVFDVHNPMAQNHLTPLYKPDVHIKTSMYPLPSCREPMWSLDSRCKNHVKQFIFDEVLDSGSVVPTLHSYDPAYQTYFSQALIPGTYWIVTHGIVMSKIAEHIAHDPTINVTIHGKTLPARPNYVDALVCEVDYSTRSVDVYYDASEHPAGHHR